MVHGDDFVAAGSKADLVHTRRTLETKYKLKIKILANPTTDQIPFDVNTNLIIEFYR